MKLLTFSVISCSLWTYRISAPANPVSGSFLEIQLWPEFWPNLAGFGAAVPYGNTFYNS